MLVMFWHETLIDFDARRFPGAAVIGISHLLDDVPDVRRYANWAALENSLKAGQGVPGDQGIPVHMESHEFFPGAPEDSIGDKQVSYYRIKSGLWKALRPGKYPFWIVLDVSQRGTGDWCLALWFDGVLVQQWLPFGDYGDPMPMDPTLWDRLSRGGLEG